MITITQKARDKMKDILDSTVHNPLIGLRLEVNGSEQYVLETDVEKPGDEVVKHGGSKILFIGKDKVDNFDGYTIDFESRKKFVISKGPLTGFHTDTVKLNI
jgi:Fe-S cluster assembly iron-binding protein IscA